MSKDQKETKETPKTENNKNKRDPRYQKTPQKIKNSCFCEAQSKMLTFRQLSSFYFSGLAPFWRHFWSQHGLA